MKVSVLVLGLTSGKPFHALRGTFLSLVWLPGLGLRPRPGNHQTSERKVPLAAWKVCLQFCHDLDTYFPTLQNVYSLWVSLLPFAWIFATPWHGIAIWSYLYYVLVSNSLFRDLVVFFHFSATWSHFSTNLIDSISIIAMSEELKRVAI